ncbi:cyclic GMP-AMP synthase DncV-like nucleotidyltransferase [Shewanella sp. MBTL60-007]|uniref:CBASS cGAMP synthase n=1 Tax=Shewanella sp. MBTL60-007 TaxID=2815911 RepID=UPI001BB94212|nr:hypothetical protein [Shewanella sp. MBTL60-007]GIU24319.1 hypothetical protein TUM3792_28950 [Shewanella sp. MBTL60-007]
MGKSAVVFYSTNDEKETVSKRVTLLDEQLEYARTKKNELLSYLKKELSNNLNIPVGYWLQGSYKNRTLIRPVRKGEEFDIDAGVYLLFNAESSAISAIDAKSIFRKVLSLFCERSSEAKLEDPKPNCERISYPGSFHIDLPLYYFDKESDLCKLATQNSGWIDSDPKSIQDWFDAAISKYDANQKARLRRCIKNIKTWVALKRVKLPSIAITIYIAQKYRDFEHDDDVCIQNFYNLANYLIGGGEILSPINGDDLIGANEEEKQKLHTEAKSLIQYITSANDSDSASEAHPYWSAIFEHVYPPFAEIEIENGTINLPALTTPPIINVRKKDKNGRFIADSSADIINGYIDESLDFTITNSANYPYNATAKWMVRNKETDASLANDLGHFQIYPVTQTCPEYCGYRGTHYMECVVEADGVVLGMKSIQVRVSKMARPLRNPQRKSYGVRR